MSRPKTTPGHRLRPLLNRSTWQPAAAAVKAATRVTRVTRDPRLGLECWRLQELARHSFKGWATPHETRWWEYPWVVAQVRQRREGRTATAVDFGAGRSPIPIAVSRLGLATSVVDPDSVTQMNKTTGAEWKWTDYGRWGVRTIRAGVEDPTLFQPDSLGFALCVSVIEHLPAEVRRAGIKNMATFLEPGGVAVFTVDLVRGSSQLWNRVLGEEVEPLEQHGDLNTLIDEARETGLRLEESARCPMHDRRVDVHGLVFRKT